MWEELYEAHYSELYRYACGACGNQTEAEDVAQEVFIRAMQSGEVFEDLGPSQMRAWLFRTLKNLICDRYRRNKAELSYLEKVKSEDSYLDPGLQQVENELLLSYLDPEDRAIFYLRYMEGYNSSELSELFDLPPGTIRARLSHCRKKLKIMLLSTGGMENG